MSDKDFSEMGGFLSRWFATLITAACFIIALFFNSGYWFFIPFEIPITVLLWKEKGCAANLQEEARS